MKRLLATFLALVLFFVAVERSQADNPVETYPVLRADGNAYTVGRWADGQYIVATREYPERWSDGTQVYVYLWSTGAYSIQLREYPELRSDGFVWAVSQWEDGSYTATRKAAPSPETGTPPPPPIQVAFKGSIGGVVQNCGLTEIRGAIRDAAGNPVNGQRVRVTWPTGETTGIATGEEGREPGAYDVVLDNKAKDGIWHVWMLDSAGRSTSDELTVRSTKDCVSAEAANTIVINFRPTAGPAA